MKETWARTVPAFLILLLSAVPGLPQAATGNIRGTVTDKTGGVVPNCSVVIINSKTAAQRTVYSNDRGDFNVPSIPVGDYEISAQIAGFQKVTLTGIQLRVDQTAAFQIVLEPGAVTSTVQVEAAPPLLESETSSLGQVVEQKHILDMPLNGRNPFALGVLSGGTVAMQGLVTNLPIVAGGGRYASNDILLDGVDNNLRNFGGAVGRAGLAYTPSVDAVEEFKVKTNNFSAEYGHSAGYVMNATIKAGTNEYHGAAWEFLRNDQLDANNFVSNLAGKPRAAFRQNQFGASVGGAVRLPYYKGQNRTFFFMDYEGTQIRQASGSSFLNLPPATFRRGDFSGQSATIYDPATRQLGPQGVVTDTPFPGNVIPTSRLDPTALNYQSLMPANNVGAPNALSNNYLAVSPVQTKHNQGDARVDHRLSEKNNLMVRTSVSKQQQPNQGSFIYSPQEQLFNTVNTVLSDTHLFSPTVINEFRFGFNRANSSNVALKEAEATAFAAQNGFKVGPIVGFPAVNWTISGLKQSTNQFSGFGAASTNYFFENAFEWTDNITLIRGNHSIKTGVDVRRFRFDRFKGLPPSVNYYFGAVYTSNPSVSQASGLPYADFLLGLPTSVGNSSSELQWSMQRDLYFGSFAQDDWKVSRKLTLNFGFRYDVFTQPVQARDSGGVFDPNGLAPSGRAGIIVIPGKNGYSRAVIKGHHRNLAPRFGFAYQPTPRFVVRGGWGVFYSQREQNDQTTDVALNMVNLFAVNMPNANAQTTVAPLYRFNTPITIFQTIDPMFSAFTATSPFNADNRSLNAADINNSKFPMLQQFNVSLQYNLLSHLLVEASYAGARGVHWVQRIDINQEPFDYALSGKNTQANRPFNFINSAIGIDIGNVSSWYNAFNLKVEHRFNKGLQILANYTISHATDSGNAGVSNLTNQGNTRAMDPYNLKLESGLSGLDIPQKFVLSADYELPIGKGKPLDTHGWLNHIVGGWQTNGIFTLRSGFPSDILVGQLPPIFPNLNRPNVVLGQSTVMANPTFNQYFNPAAFAVPPTVKNVLGAPVQTFGNASRMVLRGPGSKNLDCSLFKNFQVTEKKVVQFRAEAFNVSNTPTFQLPSAQSAQMAVGNPAFGQLAGAQTVGRQVQFGLKLRW